MRDQRRKRLFQRFRDRGDAAALGKLFDAAAPELYRVACGLVREPGVADDLVQETFLTAIERAAAYDATRPLTPWLVGILVRHARAVRRDRGRTPDPDRLDRPGPPGPDESAERAELTAEVDRAIDALPPRYHAVIAPYLRDGRTPAEIALAKELAPGTVRMQIHRGLDLLRRALPAGVALGAAWRVGVGTDAVRAAVLHRGAALRAAAAAGGAAAGTAASSTAIGGAATVLGGTAMTMKLFLSGGAVALAAVLFVVLGPLLGESPAPLAVLPAGTADARLDAPRSGEPLVGSVDPTPVDVPAAREIATPAREPGAVAWEDALAGLTGRLVEPDGAPAPGIAVGLIEIPEDVLRPGVDAVLEERPPAPELLRDRAVTDAEGNFRLEGARAGALHALRIDLTGGRPALLQVDVALAPGRSSDLGTIELPAARALAGTIVDANGAPLAGARVRVGQLSRDMDWAPFAAIAGDTPIRVGAGILGVFFEPPPWYAESEELVPLATAFTGVDGRFTFARTIDGPVTVLVDRSGFVPYLRNVDATGDVDLGPLALDRGREVEGIVFDEEGSAAAGIEVRAGVHTRTGWGRAGLAVLSERARTDERGRFAFAGLHEEGELLVAARRTQLERWVVRSFDPGEAVKVVLPALHTLHLAVRDAEGRPVGGAEVRVTRTFNGPDFPLAELLRGVQVVGDVVPIGAGTFEVRGLSMGPHQIVARAPGFALGTADARVRRGGGEVELTLHPERSLIVHVSAEEAGAPVPGAQVALLSESGAPDVLARAAADESGAARLIIGTLPDGAVVRVEHPAFAPRRVPVSDASAELEVTLDGGGAVLVRVRREGEAPRTPLTVHLEPAGDDVPTGGARRLRARTDGEGDALVSRLAPGRWRWRVVRERDGTDLLRWIEGVSTQVIEVGEVLVTVGGTTRVNVELAPSEDIAIGTGVLEGHVLLDGERLPGGNVALFGMGDTALEMRNIELDADGGFRFSDLPAGDLQFQVQQTQELEGGRVHSISVVHHRQIELAEGERRALELDWSTHGLEVHVLDDTGAPVEGAVVSVSGTDASTQGLSRSANSDEAGTARLELWVSGSYRVRAASDNHGVAREPVTVEPGLEAFVELRLDLGVPFAGELRLEGEFERFEWMAPSLHLTALDWNDENVWGGFSLEGSSGSFRLTGVRPGRYEANVFGTSQLWRPVEVTVPVTGVEDLSLLFEQTD